MSGSDKYLEDRLPKQLAEITFGKKIAAVTVAIIALSGLTIANEPAHATTYQNCAINYTAKDGGAVCELALNDVNQTSFTPPAGVTQIDVLVVGSGGGAPNTMGISSSDAISGGGGGGEVKVCTNITVSSSNSYSVTIADATPNVMTADAPGVDGSPSHFESCVANGGKGGASSSVGTGGESGNGNSGGLAKKESSPGNYFAGGGGAGAGGPGSNATGSVADSISYRGGAGGPGLSPSTIIGAGLFSTDLNLYGGGGGGGGWNGWGVDVPGTAGSGGGGGGTNGWWSFGKYGESNTGGGGGGNNGFGYGGGGGGSGVIKIRYAAIPVVEVTGISPNTGSVVGGTRITISGTGLSGLTSLAMGAYACTNLTIVNDTSAYCDTTANNGDPVSYSVYVNGSVTGLSYQYNENSGGGGGTTLTADQTSVSIGNSVSFTTNETGSNMSALFFNGAIPAAVGGNEWFGDVTNTPNPFGWSLFPVCTTGTLTYRVYDSPVAGSHPLWTDSYAASVDVTWVGDESACGGSNTISAGSSTLTYGNSVAINTSVEMGDEVAFFVDGAYAFGGPYEGPIADLPWWVFGECNDVTVTIRVYDTAPGLSPKTWSDAYADSVDIEVLGDASACSNGGGGHSGGGGGGNSAPSKPSVNDVNVTKSSGSLHIQANYTGTYLNAPTYYRVTVSPGGNSCDTNSLFGSCDILGLNPNIDYTVTIVAINSLGSSASLVLPTKFRLSGSSSFKMLGSKTISQFAGDSAKLTATFKASIKKYLKAHPTLHVFTCTGYIAGKAVTKLQKKLALARAKAVCGYIHLLRPTDAVTTIGKTPGLKFLAANRKVIIRAYGG